jgi:hypothetical protein
LPFFAASLQSALHATALTASSVVTGRVAVTLWR